MLVSSAMLSGSFLLQSPSEVLPLLLQDVAGVCSEEFRGSQQRNAHDFLSSLLNWLHEDLTRVSGEGNMLDSTVCCALTIS